LNNLISSGGVTDAHWTSTTDVTYDPTGIAQTVFSNDADWFGGWVANGPSSDWIARNAGVTNNGPAPYSFSTTFDLTGYDLSTIALSGFWTIDDQGTLNLNGNQISSLGDGNWGSLASFTAHNSDFVAGLNTLSITITADDEFLEGVRLQGDVTGSASGVPLPAAESGAAVLMALVGVWSLRSRRQTA